MERSEKDMLVAPFPYFGGKSTVADVVWQALGDVKHYIEPFCGSAAVLLARPDYRQGEHIETINDKDGMVANCWRALQFAPDEVARWCDWPVNHADLMARRKALIAQEGALLDGLAADPECYDAKMAGYWIWAASAWIGHGLTKLGQIPHLSGGGQGVHKLGQIPKLTFGGQGVHKLGQIPDSPDDQRDVREPYNDNIYHWFRVLSERLRYVRVVCGDWTRVCGGNWQDNMGTVGIFFDPPYAILNRDKGLYHEESLDVAHDVRRWCLERGSRSTYRIVLAGYDEHEELAEHGWRKYSWVAGGGYGNQGKGQGKANRKRETLWFSPYCQDRQDDYQSMLMKEG